MSIIIFFFVSLFVEVVEFACGMESLQMGEFVPNASNGIDAYCTREPLGVCAAICPSNFPAVISLWVCCLTSLYLILGCVLQTTPHPTTTKPYYKKHLQKNYF